MSSAFNIVRGCLLGSVAAWTSIVLGIALHFQLTFEASSEMLYVPLAVFAAISTFVVFLLLIVGACMGILRPIYQTRWELLWLGLLAAIWLALGGLTTSPQVADSEVECWEEEDGQVVETDVEGYSNEVYHARYRVMQAFAFFNAVLLLGLFLFILLLALWHHQRGRFVIWTTPTTSAGWFDKPATRAHLPAPVTDKFGRYRERKDSYKELKDEKLYTAMPSPKKDRKERGDYDIALPEKVVTKPIAYMPKVTSPAPPIASKMLYQARQADGTPTRQKSQREIADQARQEARRDRNVRTDPAETTLTTRQPARRTTTSPAVARPTAPTRGQSQRQADDTARPSAGARQQTAPAIVRQATQPRRDGASQPLRPPVLARNLSSARRI